MINLQFCYLFDNIDTGHLTWYYLQMYIERNLDPLYILENNEWTQDENDYFIEDTNGVCKLTPKISLHIEGSKIKIKRLNKCVDLPDFNDLTHVTNFITTL